MGVTVLDLIGDGSDNTLAVLNPTDSPGTVSLFVRRGSNFALPQFSSNRQGLERRRAPLSIRCRGRPPERWFSP